jgi:hypothetical protein
VPEGSGVLPRWVSLGSEGVRGVPDGENASRRFEDVEVLRLYLVEGRG